MNNPITPNIPDDPLYWITAGMSNAEMYEVLSYHCLDDYVRDGIYYECCLEKGHDGPHAGYGHHEDGTESYTAWMVAKDEQGAVIGKLGIIEIPETDDGDRCESVLRIEDDDVVLWGRCELHRKHLGRHLLQYEALVGDEDNLQPVICDQHWE